MGDGFKAHDPRHGGRYGRQVQLGPLGLARRYVEVSVAEEERAALVKARKGGRPKRAVGARSAAERMKAYRERRKAGK
jgi:hypothetical protein